MDTRASCQPLFGALAGTGEFIAGSYAAYLMLKPESARRYLSFHVFGFADFVVAVGTGLIFTLLQDPRMGLIAVLPMALISAASPLAYRSFFEEFLIPAANAAGVPI